MARRALLVGIDEYDNMKSLKYCVKDVEALKPLLKEHELDSYPNYHVWTLTSDQKEVTRARLYKACEELFKFDDTVLFYFSGHSLQPREGQSGWLVTQDGTPEMPGLAYQEILGMANRSPASSVLLIVDSCYSGELGRPPDLPQSYVRIDEGVTILSASRPAEEAYEDSENGQGVFTRLLIEGLKGAAADLRGRVNAASLYACISRGLGPWDQRPTYKCNVTHQRTVRRCRPIVEERDLHQMTDFFESPEAEIAASSVEANVLDRLLQGRLVKEARSSKSKAPPPIALTCLGRTYWSRARGYHQQPYIDSIT